MGPLVTVITPAYNCGNVLRHSIESVKNQSYANWEHIIVDDHSADDTCTVINKAAGVDNRIKPMFLNKNGGAANARNIGISAADGKYIAFLDSDDLWKPEKLEKHIGYMEANSCYFTYSDYEMIDCDGKFLKNVIARKEKVDYRELLDSNQIGCLTVVVRSEVMKAVLMPDIKHEDYAAWLELLKNHVKYAERLGEVLASYRVAKGSVSSNKLRTIAWTWHIYRRHQGLGFFESIRHLIIFEALALIKHLKR